jgi:peptidoglycan hydrolase-like protein with peptidoglycan-binding domain
MKFSRPKTLAAGAIMAAVVVGGLVTAAPASAAASCVAVTQGPGYSSNTPRCVKDLQKMLNNTHIVSVGVDGAYGNKTATAVRYFQNNTSYGLTVDGITGPKTWSALCKANGRTSAAIDAGCKL